MDSSPVLAPARLKKYKKAAAAAADAAAAKDKKHRLLVERWRQRYWGVRTELDEVRQELSAAQAGQQQQHGEAAQAAQQQQQ